MIRIGYACINTILPSPNRTCRLKNATRERIEELARENFGRLAAILEWNRDHAIHLFRISSETIPFASHESFSLDWETALAPEIDKLRNLIRLTGMRISMHPGQFTVLNSPKEKVVENSIRELDYHAALLDALAPDMSHKIVLHIGGVYGDKAASILRFKENFQRLPDRVKTRLIVENDEKNYTAADVHAIAVDLGIPAVFDIFHHSCHPFTEKSPIEKIIQRAMETWKAEDGRPKLHYSDQWPGKHAGAHSKTVDMKAFKAFYEIVRDLAVDVMIEVKDKEQSVLKIYNEIPDLRGLF